jgi:hypothetical protein
MSTSTLTPFLTLASTRLSHQLATITHYLSGASPRHSRLSTVILATASARAKSREDLRLCFQLNTTAQGIIEEADESLRQQLKEDVDSGNEEMDGNVAEMNEMRRRWGECRKVKVLCLRLEHLFHVIEGLLGEE